MSDFGNAAEWFGNGIAIIALICAFISNRKSEKAIKEVNILKNIQMSFNGGNSVYGGAGGGGSFYGGGGGGGGGSSSPGASGR